MPKVVVHIGTHKTGTTSIQHVLNENRINLSRRGIAFFRGRHHAANHVELHAASMRTERLSPFKIKSGVTGDAAYRDSVRSAVGTFLSEVEGTAVFSAEGLSFLRYRDEVDWLRGILPDDVKIVVYLRDKAQYQDSHRAQLARHPLTSGYDDPNAVFYIGDDSYLLDYELRLRPWRDVFGTEHVQVIDYDEKLQRDGSVVPSFLEFLGVADIVDPTSWRGIFLNRRRP